MHFSPADVQRETTFFDEATGRRLTAKLNFPKLRDGAIPSILPNCPSYLSSITTSRDSPDERRNRQEEKALQTALAQSVVDEEHHRKEREFFNLRELKEKLNFLDTTYWSIVNQDESLLICRVIQSPHPNIVRSIVIKENCSLHIYINDVEVHRLGEYKIPDKVNDTNDLDRLLCKLRKTDAREYRVSKPCNTSTLIHLVISLLSVIKDESFKHFSALKFVCEQLQLMTLNKLEYSSELLIFSSLFYNCSRQGYRLLRENKFLILPSYATIRRIFLLKTFGPDLEQKPSNFLVYIKNKFKMLQSADKSVILMVDEIHIKPSFDYKGGSIVGSAFDTAEAATSAYVFMISSIMSKYKDVVHIIPAKCMKAEILHDILRTIIIGLEKIGFQVICVITDNNAINGKALSLFAKPPKLSIVYPHPVESSRPLFFMYDSVHLLKCIRNNWINQKDTMKTMRYPEFSSDGIYYENHKIELAPFKTLRQLYTLEADNLLKYSHKLSLKAISPSNLERQNVKLAVQIFNEYVIQALLTIGKKHSLTFYSSVANYIKLIYTWWTVMNVQAPSKGIMTRNKYATPLTANTNDEKLEFLENFCKWLEVWDNIQATGGKLTRETFTALRHTTHAIIEITKYCTCVLNMRYILTAKFQTDKLESRFGQYRQLAGGNYNISIRQIFECEKKIRIMSVLERNLPIHNQRVVLKNLDTNWEDMERQSHLNDIEKFNLTVSQSDIDKCKEVLPVIVYLAGYYCYAVFKKTKCSYCKDLVTYNNNENDMPENHNYIDGISRGSLMHPDPITTNIVMYTYIVVNKMAKDAQFHKIPNQRLVASTITLNLLTDDEALLPTDSCDAGHSTEKIEKMVIWASTNALLNNYCSKENNSLAEKKIANTGKKRKLKTLTQSGKQQKQESSNDSV